MLKSLKSLSLIMLILIFCLGILVYYNTVEISNKKSLREEALNRVASNEFSYFKGIISENYQKAKLFIEDIANQTRADILSVPEYQEDYNSFYSDMYDFNQDNHKIINIIGNNFEGKYLNGIENDNNDPFVMTKLDGIIGDFSLNCSAFGRTRTFEEEYSMHYSPLLAEKAVARIRSQLIPNINQGIVEDPIGWSFLAPKENISLVTDFTWDNLEKAYKQYGLEGMRSYEWLYPTYVDSEKDLLGVRNVTPAGFRQDNKQLIFVSGFNVVDIINNNKNHLQTFNLFETQKKQIESSFSWAIILHQVTNLSTIILFLALFFSLLSYYNREIDILRERAKIVEEECSELILKKG